MARKSIFIGIAVIVIVLSSSLTGCVKEPEPDLGSGNPAKVLDDSMATPEMVDSVVEANNRFAIDFYLELMDKEDNIFFSPYSISVALAMTYEGAGGQTAEKMRSVFYFPENDTTRRSGFASLHNQINGRDREYTLSTANALWAHEDYQFLEEYFDIIESYYDANITNLDLVGDPEGSRVMINDWVEEQTNDRIKDLLPKGSIDYLTRLVLTNAIYFKGQWLTQFDKDDTSEQDFRVSDQRTVKVPMMSIRDERFNCSSTGDIQILELPYKGEDISMLILLPENDDLDSLENSISVENLTEWRNSLTEQQIDIYIPKFKFETKYFMKETLGDMGMPTAFDPNEADFSKMDGTKNLYLTSVIHQGYIEVNEEGTEAAAATGAVAGITSVPPSFRADHPFIFLIQDNDTGSILFMGRVLDPSL